MVDTSNEWTLERTGIHERHIAEKDVATSDLAVEAAKIALERGKIDPASIDAILLCTVTPDMLFPSTACLVQHKLELPKAWGFDLIAACCSFAYGINTAAQFVMAGMHRRVLVVGADTMSRIVDYKDRATCILFGDGAGAMVVEAAADDEDTGFIDSLNQIDGSGGPYLNMPAGGSQMPASHETVDQRLHYVHQDGQQVFKFAVRKMYEFTSKLLEKNNLTPDDVSVLVPPQANMRIIKATCERLGISEDRVIINIDRFGNTTSATIPLAAQDAVDSGRLKKGDLALIAAVGAGFTMSSSLWRWSF
jgi:3-oxoacyl-[acyl-carrier-protein] synthase-3